MRFWVSAENRKDERKMAKEFLTDAQVDTEIGRLLDSKMVKLARRDQTIRNRKRQYMYQLRWLEKRGFELAKMGVTLESLEEEDRRMQGLNEEDEFCDD
jgi:hypothetical protein